MRRRLAVVLAAVLPLVAGCSSTATSAAADVTTVEGWLSWLEQDPDNVAFVVDDGLGHTAERRADEQQPLASAAKVVPLAAYARAVAAGTVDPQEQIPVAEWERWYLPKADGGAHEQARKRLPGDTVTLDQLVSAMIQESDNAAPDYLRDRLGDKALIEAAAAGGWHDYMLFSPLGSMLRLAEPDIADEWAAARRYAADPAYRAAILSKSPPSYTDQVAWAETTWTGSARQLTSLYRAFATGSFGPGAEIARAHLEWQPPPTGFVGLGFKGGALASILTEAMSLRRADGTVATAVLLNRRMPESTWSAALKSFRHQELLFRAMTEPEMLHRLP
ncbi:serine hydrolase [Nocardia brasiliensis]|nr:serine hydrolase [Nocardia brasiliensis]OCF85956.1 serine hydrolase [Nocardia brasiliensis]